MPSGSILDMCCDSTMMRRLRCCGNETLIQAVFMAACFVTPGKAFTLGSVRTISRLSTASRVAVPFRAVSPLSGRRARLRGFRSGGGQAGLARMSAEVGQRSPAVSEESVSPAIMEGNEGTSKPTVKKRVLSGVQPTGNLHLGNYLGAVKQWVDAQDERDNFFSVVDLHAITVPQDPKKLTEGVLSAAATYLAAGIDPAKSTVFVQSHVSAHSELAWLLSCVTPVNWLERMVQYKEKRTKQGENVGAGLLTYPVLMAADILLYQPDLVPVGEDQRQHLELTRDIARRFNDQFCKRRRRVFKDPQALIVKEGARVMSLTDGTSKMSKSDPVEGSRINLTDSPDVITKKLRKCKTDLLKGLEWDNPERPECTNLLTIYQAVTGKSRDEIALEVQDMSWGTFKPILAEATVAHLEPFQTRYKEILQDRTYLNKVLRDGAETADEVASKTVEWTKEAMGIPLLKTFQ